MLLNVVFSFNRAMQLDFFLRSTLERFRVDYETVVVYHTTGEHALGYRRLMEKYRGLNVEFLERSVEASSQTSRLRDSVKASRLRRPTIGPKRDNFKPLLEATLLRSPCELVMFNTDDGYWFDDFHLDPSLENLIKHNPTTVSYRTYVGDNLTGFPDFVKRWGDHYLWDYYTAGPTTHWTYPFAVDGTVYDTQAIAKLLQTVDYWNPVTLEGNTVLHVISEGLLGVGLGPLRSQLVGTKLNRVATETRNPTIHLDPDLLNKKYLEGYRLELRLPPVDNANLVPKQVILRRGLDELVLYEMDAFGREVQANLDTGGAKKEMD